MTILVAYIAVMPLGFTLCAWLTRTGGPDEQSDAVERAEIVALFTALWPLLLAVLVVYLFEDWHPIEAAMEKLAKLLETIAP